MKWLTCVVALLLFGNNTLRAENVSISKDDMVKFVKEALDFAKTQGKEVSLKEFTDGSQFKRDGGELYIYAYDFEGNCIAHGSKSALVGKNLIAMKDKSGKDLIRELRDAAKNGEGFVDFHWENPSTKKVESKLGYVMKVDDSWWLGSGIYSPQQ